VLEKHKSGLPVTRGTIRIKALEIATSLKIPQQDFKASNGWAVRFMRRKVLALRRRTTLAKKLPTDYVEKLIAYQRHIINLCQKHDYLLGQIGNADEIPVFFDMPANTTVDTKFSKSVLVKTTGHEKLRITMMLSVLADGRKLIPFVILKRKNLPKEEVLTEIIFKCNEKGWMTEEFMVEWLREVWQRRPGAFLKKRGMLVSDAFKGHLTEKVKTVASSLLNIDLLIIPGGMTSQLQVLDLVANKPFKDRLCCLYGEWLLSGNCPLTPAGNIRRPSEALLGQWIKTAWNDISPESIGKGFKKCCVSNDMNGTEDDDVLWEQNHEENSSSSDESVDRD
jgi:hypothetical protein